MPPPVSSSDSSVDDTGVQAIKAAQAEQFRKLSGPPNLSKFKEAQVEGLKGDPIRHSVPKKPRPNAVDQTAASRARSTQHQHQHQNPTSAAQLLQLLASDDRETKDTRRLLHSALAQLDASSRRLAHSDAERRQLESSQLAQTAQTLHAASTVQQHAAAAQAELSLYKLQMEHAQQEILRAQAVVRTLETQRDDAERAAARARAAARKLHVEKMAILAREEGRKEGYETGFGHGRVIAAAREQRRIEQRRVEEAQRRRIEVAPPVREQGGAFIEEDSSVEEDLSRGLPQMQTQGQTQTRRPRDSLESIRQPPVVAPQPEPRMLMNTNHAPPRRPASAMSSSTARRVSAPPVVAQQQAPRARTASDAGSRAASRAGRSSVILDPVPPRSSTATPQHNRRASIASRHSNSNAASNASINLPASANAAQQPRRRSTS
ncbi:hypothetical protein DFH09DRAFT_1400651, partial [Mycena vulgaris]